MNEREFEAEEFERLLALPEGHPERVQAERSSRFIAWKRMLEDFESPPDELTAPHELERAEAELAERVERAKARLDMPEPSRQRSDSSFQRGRAGGWWASLRPAFALAAVAVAAAVGWWSFDRLHEGSAVRSSGEDDVAVRALSTADGVDLRWSAVPGATMYRLIFLGPDLTERARIDSLHDTRYELPATNLPVGLARGEPTLVEVTAFRPTGWIISKPIPIQVP
jgi:hypothetical protein